MNRLLQKTFIHLPGIGPKMEKRLWDKGFLSWEDLYEKADSLFSPQKALKIKEVLRKSMDFVDNPCFFYDILPKDERWRLFGAFKDVTCYLDIETYFYDGNRHKISIVGIYDGKMYRPFIRGINLEEMFFFLNSKKLIVTFGGSTFDIPQLKKNFPHYEIKHAHVDLCPVLQKMGLNGGLKKIEERTGILRPQDVKGLNGYDAVKLWRAYRRGNKKALLRLIRYNKEDTVNLAFLMKFAYENMCKKLPINKIEVNME